MNSHGSGPNKRWKDSMKSKKSQCCINMLTAIIWNVFPPVMAPPENQMSPLIPSSCDFCYPDVLIITRKCAGFVCKAYGLNSL